MHIYIFGLQRTSTIDVKTICIHMHYHLFCMLSKRGFTTPCYATPNVKVSILAYNYHSCLLSISNRSLEVKVVIFVKKIIPHKLANQVIILVTYDFGGSSLSKIC